MDQLIVTLDKQNHKIGEAETTECGLPVPIGSTDQGAKPCPECFPKANKATKEA